MTTKVQQLPPLSKSRQKDLGCQAFYIAHHVRGMQFESDAARRGTEIHAVVADYVAHLMLTQRQTDYEYFDRLIAHAGEEAKGVLEEKFRDSYFFDPQKVLGTELHIALNSRFEPLEPRDDPASCAYEGTLDLVLLHSPTAAEVHDWKSYFQIVDADSFEAVMYCLLLFCLSPALEEVRFVLEFVRYGATREVVFTRADVPEMKKRAERERVRQVELHEAAQLAVFEPEASPGRHCVWCPLLAEGCPMSKQNPYKLMEPDRRLAQTMWLKNAYEHSLAVLKDFVVERGPIDTVDDNGERYRAEFRPKEMRSYPLSEAGPILRSWAAEHSEDLDFIAKLTVGGLSSPLKAKKRAELKAQFEGIADVRVVTELKVAPAREAKEEEAA